ncbi:MAG: hypothetical protein WC744_03660 [Patescibacteria group bacterium]|jgi:hypothetical protein
MKLAKFFVKETAFSKILAIILFLSLPTLSFNLGLDSQKKLDSSLLDNRSTLIPSPTLIPNNKIPSPNKQGWLRYMSDSYDYYLDYPDTYYYNKLSDPGISFEKRLVKTPHGVDNYINIIKGQSSQETKEKISELKNMFIGEKKVVTISPPAPNMDQFLTYERLSDIYIDNKKIKVFVNKKPFEAIEGAKYYLYLYEGKVNYIIGGLINESTDSLDNISYKEFKDIVSTIRFLD